VECTTARRRLSAAIVAPVVAAALPLTTLALIAGRATAGTLPEVSATATAVLALALETVLWRRERRIRSLVVALRRTDELKDEFVAATSHELRSPLTAILGFAALLTEFWQSVDDEHRREYVARIEHQGRRLDALVRDLLTLSAIDAGSLRLAPAATPVAVVLAAAVDEAALPSPVDVRCTPDLVAWADAERFRQIVIALLSNAGKYGAPPFAVEATGDRGAVIVTVSDHGPGVPGEFQPRLFESFSQASAGLSRQATGAGLGLAVADRLARAQAGTITYHDTPGGGASFTLRLRAWPGRGERAAGRDRRPAEGAATPPA
jgi:signal transduction histidine kinase